MSAAQLNMLGCVILHGVWAYRQYLLEDCVVHEPEGASAFVVH